jgi:PAS domain S-box-containing protein
MNDRAIPLQDEVLDAIDAGLIVVDRDHRIVCWNAWMESATGHSAKSVRDQPLATVFPRADLRRLETVINAALDSGVSSLLSHALHPLLFPLKTRAGRELLHDVTVRAISRSHRGTCLIHIADVTMAVRRERYLRDRQNARYDAVVASAPDVILTLDGDGVIRLANQAAVVQFGYAEDELLGEPATFLFETEGLWNQTWRTVLQVQSIRRPVELVARRKDGSLTYLELSASQWQTDTHVFVTAILRDVNERREAERALRASEEQARAAAEALAELNSTLEQRVRDGMVQLLEAEEALRQSHKMEAIGQLTGGIAHDFNNLLQGIIGALNMVQRRVGEGRIADIDRFLKGALTSADRASALTHRLLAFSRRQPVDPRPLDVNQLVGTIEELLRRAIGEKIRMKFELADDLWLIRCDANQLENGLLNLAINARDAMPDGGTLTIATSNRTLDAAQAAIRDLKPGNYVALEISDDGVGMSTEVQTRAFDPFYTTKPLGQGTGLGLSMIYGFVRQSNGSIRIRSQEGKGTTVEVCLPRFMGDLEPIESAEVEADNAQASHNEVVLVVEDEDVVRLLVVEVLNDLGYHPLEASDGHVALNILQSAQRIDLLITDIGLPKINGRQVADAARVVRANLQVLFMTGYAESAADSEFLETGMHIIAKPFTMDKLTAKIREIFENRVQ